MSKIEGLSQLENFLTGEFRDALIKAARTTEERVADEIVAEMKSLAPVDSGTLRNSINWQRISDEVLVEVQAAYAYFVEFGTVDTPAQPFFYPTVDTFQRRLLEILGEEMEKNL